MGDFELHAPLLIAANGGCPLILRSVFESKSSAYEWCINTLESELC